MTIAAIRRDSKFLDNIPDDCKNDRDLILTVIRQTVSPDSWLFYPEGLFAKCVSMELKQDSNFILECVKATPHVLDNIYIYETIYLNPEIVYEHVKRRGIVTDFCLGMQVGKSFTRTTLVDVRDSFLHFTW